MQNTQNTWMRHIALALFCLVGTLSSDLSACPKNCDETYLPIFREWAKENGIQKDVWGEGANISGPLDISAVEKCSIDEMIQENILRKSAGFTSTPLYPPAENAEAKDDSVPEVPFGYANDKWKIFIQKLQSGDTLHAYSMDDYAKGSMMADEGYAIIRNGKIIERFITVFY
jgi:hypothetical protein